MKKNPGYILVLTLLILSLATIIVTKLFVQAKTYNAFALLDTKREQARHLAQSGVAIAIAQLSLHDATFKPKEDKEKKGQPTEKQIIDAKARQLLKTLLLVQNRWQTFVLTQEQDGIEATINVCITCEDGKINLNRVWDFKNHRFSSALLRTQDPAKLFGMLGEAAAPFTQNKNMFDGVVETLKKRQQQLFDVTELLTNTKLWDFKDHVFFEPPVQTVKADTDALPSIPKKEKEKIALTDLFTVWTDEATMYPLLLSSSMRTLFRLPAQTPATKEFAKEIDTIVEKIPIDGINWMQDWNTYAKPFFGKDLAAVPKEIIPFLGAKFEPRIFSVLCYAEVGTVKQKLLAILERSRVEKGEEFKVKKIYWI